MQVQLAGRHREAVHLDRSVQPPAAADATPDAGGRVDPRRRRLLGMALGTAVAGLGSGLARAREVSGFEFADTVTVAGRPLVLNGVGLRSVFIMKVFLGALYVPERSREPATLMAQTGPRRVQMRMLIDMSPERIFKSFESGERNAAPPPALETALTAVGPVGKGGVLDMDLIDGRLHFAVNGLARGSVQEGDQSFHAIMSAWLGERPIERDLKLGLLGLAVPGQ